MRSGIDYPWCDGRFRYMLMYEYGGFYMDLDFEALGSLETVGKDHDIIIGQEVANAVNPLTSCSHWFTLTCSME